MGSINKLMFLHQVRKNQWLNPLELEKLQIKRLRKIVKHAYENTEFYHQKFKNAGILPDDIKTIGDIKKIPFTTKEELRDNWSSILTKGVDLNKCRIVPTSGSTGKPLKVVYDEAADDFSKAINLRSMMENGLEMRSKWVNIGDTRTISRQHWLQKKFGIFNLITLGIFDRIEDQVSTLIDIDPEVITGYPSQLSLIANYIKRNSIDNIRPKIVFTTAELLNDNTRKLINSAFDLELVDLFGCIEVNRTAWECSEHMGYHLDVDSVITEFIRDNEDVSAGERGKLVYTSLYNYAMPIIRYDVGDIGIPSDDYCECGRGLPMMKSVEGRSDDFVVLPGGKIVSPITLALVMKHSSEIIEYQIIQHTINKICIYIVVSEKFNDLCIEKIRQDAQMALGNEISIDIKIQDNIKKGGSGKIRSVISKVKEVKMW